LKAFDDKAKQKLYQRLSGILALKNFRRNRRRYRSIILSLILSVVLCVSAGSLGADLKLLTEAYVADVEGDIFFYPDGMEPEELAQLYGSLGTVEGVYRSEDQAPDMGYGQVGLTFWSSSPAQSAEKMKLVIEAMGVTGSYTLLNVHEKLEENRNMLFIVNLFAVVFIVMISLIATVNVFNTISTNVRLRRRELAMLRSVGMGDREFGRMMRFECLRNAHLAVRPACGDAVFLADLPGAGGDGGHGGHALPDSLGEHRHQHAGCVPGHLCHHALRGEPHQEREYHRGAAG
jgi:hypothetical protein